MINKNELELYIHIPFCIRKCNYCDFLSWAGSEDERRAYVYALVNEIRTQGHRYADRKISSVYIGGGTPSVLSEDEISLIVQTLTGSFDLSSLGKKKIMDNELTDLRFLSSDQEKTAVKKKKLSLYERFKGRPRIDAVEFSIECNPGTLTAQKLQTYRKLGVNRLSIGLQSAIPKELDELGRIHTVQDFLESFELAREAGFNNINVDLMQAVPHQTPASWRKSLLMAAALRPEHISAYSLIIEEGTPFHEKINNKNDGFASLFPDEDTERDIYHSTREMLETAGYSRYEISNYALPGFECRHNGGYWQRRNYLGLGLGASSLVDDTRWKNTSDTKKYMEFWSREHAADELFCKETGIFTDIQHLEIKDRMEEYMFLGLRMSNGISKEDFEDTFARPYDLVYGQLTEHMIAQGLMREIRVTDKKRGCEHRICLTDRGMDVSNTVMAEFLIDS